MWMRPCLEIGYAKPDFTTLDEVDKDGETGSIYFGLLGGIIVGGIVIGMVYVGLKAYAGSTRAAATRNTGDEEGDE